MARWIVELTDGNRKIVEAEHCSSGESEYTFSTGKHPNYELIAEFQKAYVVGVSLDEHTLDWPLDDIDGD